MPHRPPGGECTRSCPAFFYIGLGDRFDGDKVEAYPAGSVIVLPGNTSTSTRAKSGEYVTQVTAIGPLGLEYLIPPMIHVNPTTEGLRGARYWLPSTD